MNANTYAQLLIQKAQEGDFEDFFAKTIQQLKANKNEKMLKSILVEVQKLEQQASKSTKTTVVVKNKEDFEKIKTELEKYSNTFSTEEAEVVENKNIVGGFILKNKTNLVDNSYRTKLLGMYKKLAA